MRETEATIDACKNKRKIEKMGEEGKFKRITRRSKQELVHGSSRRRVVFSKRESRRN